MSVITLIGSMRNFDDFINVGRMMHMNGNIVLLPFKDNEEVIPEKRLKLYDKSIRSMIDMSSAVKVINKDFYIGKSTASEIRYAISKNKEISYTNYESIGGTYDHRLENKVVLCGSGKFKDVFKNVFKFLTINGFIVYTPSIFELQSQNVNFNQEILTSLDIIHESKILDSEYVVIINPDGYIGENTKKELDFAKKNNKKILYIKDPDGNIENEIGVSLLNKVLYLEEDQK